VNAGLVLYSFASCYLTPLFDRSWPVAYIPSAGLLLATGFYFSSFGFCALLCVLDLTLGMFYFYWSGLDRRGLGWVGGKCSRLDGWLAFIFFVVLLAACLLACKDGGKISRGFDWKWWM
jgi:hypothetical protein